MKLELKHQYLVDENEREYGANYYLKEFRDGQTLNLKLIVGPYKDKSLNESILNYVSSKLTIASSDLVEKGLFKKTTYFFELKENRITYDYMLSISNVIYDLILAFDVKVELKKV